MRRSVRLVAATCPVALQAVPPCTAFAAEPAARAAVWRPGHATVTVTVRGTVESLP